MSQENCSNYEANFALKYPYNENKIILSYVTI